MPNLFRGGGRSHLAERRETFLKLRADHLVAIHEQTHQLAHELVLAVHRPGHDRLAILRFEREVRGGRSFHRPFPIHPATHQLARLALDDRTASCAHILAALPTAYRAHTRVRAAVSILHIWIE